MRSFFFILVSYLSVLCFSIRNERIHANLNQTGGFPQNEFEYLQLLFNSTRGRHWKNNTNWKFSNITLYNPCLQRWYGLIVNCLEGTTGIVTIYLDDNNLFGALPSPLANFALLERIYLNINWISGPLPLFRNLPKLRSMSLDENALTGLLPETLFDVQIVSNLVEFSVGWNQLSGSLPGWIYNLTSLIELYMGPNSFNGTVSSQISNLARLERLVIAQNKLSGTFPSSLCSLLFLTELYIGKNMFEGRFLSTILPCLRPNVSRFHQAYLSVEDNLFQGSFSENLENLTCPYSYLDLDANYFSGTLPEWLCSCEYKYFDAGMDLSDNSFSGQLPRCFSKNLSSISWLRLQQNHFTGDLNVIFNIDSNVEALYELDLSQNSFSGSFPVELLSYPRMATLRASENCFEGGFPDDVCNIHPDRLTELKLNGLAASEFCVKKFQFLPFFAPAYTLDSAFGRIPSCFWNFPALQQLELSGNGFIGSIPDEISSRLELLSVSHNYLSGTIPKQLQELESFHYLDLSYNKLTGNIQYVWNISHTSGSVYGGYWNISNNRISGPLPSSFKGANNVNILFGNLFECSDNLPTKDPDYHNYFCGSSQLEYSSIGYGIAFTIILLWIGLLLCAFRKHNFSADHLSCVDASSVVLFFMRFIAENETTISATTNNHNIRNFFQTLDTFSKASRFVGIFAIALLLPVYLVLNLVFSASHKYEYQYGWSSTGVFLSGVNESIILLVFVLIVLGIFLSYLTGRNCSVKGSKLPEECCPRFRFIPEGGKLYQRLLGRVQNDDESIESIWTFRKYAFLAVFLSLANITITILINVLYLLTLNNRETQIVNQTGVQISMSLFKLCWNIMVVNYSLSLLKSQFPDPWTQSAIYQLRIFLLIFNTIFSPCIAAVFSDGSCFHDFFFPQTIPLVEVYYVQEGSSEVDNYTVTQMTLPFIYYYSCGSQILTSYIPVFIYSYALIPIKTLAEWYINTRLKRRDIPKSLMRAVNGVYRFSDYESFPILLKGDSITASLVLHCTVLLTFGLMSPILAVIIVTVICFECYYWKFIIISFIQYDSSGHDVTDDIFLAEKVLLVNPALNMDNVNKRGMRVNDAIGDAWLSLHRTKWRILYSSLIFIGFVLFDMAGDQQGGLKAIWVPMTIVIVIAAFRLTLAYLVRLFYRSCNSNIPEGVNEYDSHNNTSDRVLSRDSLL